MLTTDHPLAERFRAFVLYPDFPCVGAKSALARGRLAVRVARDLTSAWNDLDIYPELTDFCASYRADPLLFQSFAVVFEGPRNLTEQAFEAALWARLQSLTDKDVFAGAPPDPRVSSDPDNPHFALSFGGEAFFVVGLHPRASRPARRFEAPAAVFNLHDQFERLRAEGRYDGLRSKILARDIALAGTENPMLAPHGTFSAARQYSGRAVDAEWRCPFDGRSERFTRAA